MIVTDVYKENAKRLKKYAKTSFSLSDESLKLFCDYVDNPMLLYNDKIKALLEKYKDEVVDYRIPVDKDEILEAEAPKEIFYINEVLNNVLFEYYEQYRSFDNGCSISIKETMENKFVLFGEERKIWRFLISNSGKISKTILKSNKEVSLSKPFTNDMGISFLIRAIDEYYKGLLGKETSLKRRIDKFREDFKEPTSDTKKVHFMIKEIFELMSSIIGAIILNNSNKYNAYLSFNFFDWFLASSGEGWTSCLSLDSSTAFAYGLIGLMSNPDWGMLMISKKENKSDFGIRVPSLLARTWVIYGDNEKFNLVNWYPHDIRSRGSKDLKFKNGDIIVTSKDFNNDTKGYTWFKPFYLRNGMVPYIYADCFSIIAAKSNNSVRVDVNGNKAGIPRLFFVEGTGYTGNPNNTNYYQTFGGLCEAIGDSGYSFGGIIEYGYDALDESERGGSRECCESCGDYYDGDEMYYVNDYGSVCRHCIEHDHFFYCSNCQEWFTENTHNDITVNGDVVCGGCIDNEYGYCTECNDLVHLEDLITVDNESTCENCFREMEDDISTCNNCLSYYTSSNGITVVLKNEEGYFEKQFCSENCFTLYKSKDINLFTSVIREGIGLEEFLSGKEEEEEESESSNVS